MGLLRDYRVTLHNAPVFESHVKTIAERHGVEARVATHGECATVTLHGSLQAILEAAEAIDASVTAYLFRLMEDSGPASSAAWLTVAD